MKIRLTELGKAVAMMGRGSKGAETKKVYRKPKMKLYTLTVVDRNGKILSKEKVMIDENRVFRTE